MTRSLRLLLLAIVSAALTWSWGVTSEARAQVPEPTFDVSSSFDPPAATIGDRVTLTVRVRHTSDVVVTVERPAIEGTEVLGDAQPVTEVGADGSVITTYAFRYQVFTLGEIAPGMLRVRWLLEDGTTGLTTRDGAVMTIIPVRAPGDLELRPLKPQAGVAGAPPAWIRPAAVGLALALVAILVVAGLAIWRRRPRDTYEVGPVAVAEGTARERLDALRRVRLDGEEAFQHYYGEIALVVRGYLGQRFAFNATALTTSELERRMTGHGVDRWQARLVGGLLDRCDRAVYARQYPEPASADHDLTVAYEIIELSRPRPVAVEPAAS
jgi:hypothetical protein